MHDDQAKAAAARAALKHVEPDTIVGIGSGSTVHHFIEALSMQRGHIEGAVATSVETKRRLEAADIPVYDLNSVDGVPVYVDGADEVDPSGACLKGGGGALTQEKIVAAVAERWICIVDESKCVQRLGACPLAIEVIESARSYVARALVVLGMNPVYREGFITDNGHIILDAYDVPVQPLIELEKTLNQITGVVCHGLFAARRADQVIVGHAEGHTHLLLP